MATFCTSLKYIELDFRITSSLKQHFRVKDIMLGYPWCDSLDDITCINTIIYIFKGELWKIRNKIKHNGIQLEYRAIRINCRRNFHNNLDVLLIN